eukprot:1187443-Rhodomonas_salina.1
MLGMVSYDGFKVPLLPSENVGDQLARSATVGSGMSDQDQEKRSLRRTLVQNIKELEAGLQTWIGGKLLFKKLIALEADSTTEELLMAKTDLCNLCRHLNHVPSARCFTKSGAFSIRCHFQPSGKWG